MTDESKNKIGIVMLVFPALAAVVVMLVSIALRFGIIPVAVIVAGVAFFAIALWLVCSGPVGQ